jgi:hypothetical protein
MCIAEVNGNDYPCGVVDYLELHELWGESKDPTVGGKFQQRVMLCNAHHSLVDDKCHQYTFIQGQHQPSMLADDVELEIHFAGGYYKWVAKHKLDDSRCGCLLNKGVVKVSDMLEEETAEIG